LFNFSRTFISRIERKTEERRNLKREYLGLLSRALPRGLLIRKKKALGGGKGEGGKIVGWASRRVSGLE